MKQHAYMIFWGMPPLVPTQNLAPLKSYTCNLRILGSHDLRHHDRNRFQIETIVIATHLCPTGLISGIASLQALGGYDE